MRAHLITCTGDRPDAFALCTMWVQRWRSLIESWIVVDDGITPTPAPDWANYIRRTPKFSEHYVGGMDREPNSLAKNLLTALDNLEAKETDAVFFIEDDDYYRADYLPTMLRELRARESSCDILGQIPASYYNIRTQQYRVFRNNDHASLCQTGFKCGFVRALFHRIAEQCNSEGATDLDLKLYKRAHKRQIAVSFLKQTSQVVGIKGMPGRKGIGIGHRLHSDWDRDNEYFAILRQWLGDDFMYYVPFLGSAQADLLL